MCNHCDMDPRDVIAQAEAALQGLRCLVGELPVETAILARHIGPIIDLIHDRLDPAVLALQDYAPRSV